MSHFCEYDAHTNGRLGTEPCGASEDHAHAGRTRAPSGRLPLTEEEIRKYMEEHKDDDFDFGCDEAEEDEGEL